MAEVSRADVEKARLRSLPESGVDFDAAAAAIRSERTLTLQGKSASREWPMAALLARLCKFRAFSKAYLLTFGSLREA